MKKVILLLIASIAIAACGTPREMPGNNGSGQASDEMLKSPCVCKEQNFNSRGFEWIG